MLCCMSLFYDALLCFRTILEVGVISKDGVIFEHCEIIVESTRRCFKNLPPAEALVFGVPALDMG